jgi:uncharacterized repeat protein (TIGR01451 family)
VRIENNPTEQGYNTSSRPLQFDENNSPNFTRSFQLSAVAKVALNGTPYYEFVLDINQGNAGGDALLSLDQLRLYVSPTNIDTASNNFANGYNPATGTLGGLSPSYDMNPGLTTTNFVELNGALKSGSGTPDMTLFVPVSALGTNPNSWIYLYSHFGGHTFTSDQGNTGGAANGGFEEWANTTVETPGITTNAGPTVVLGSGTKLNDSATLAGGDNPTGTITFTLTGPGGSVVYIDVVTVSGNGTYITATQGNNPGGFLPTVPGTYHWVASYSGDLNNSPFATDPNKEPHVVDPAEPSINTNAGPTVVLGSGMPLTDSATLTGGFNPGGTITFNLFPPNGTTPVYTNVVTVNGNGTYDTSMGTNPGGFLPTAPGDYQWVASYSGDANNDPVASDSDDEPQTVTASGNFITLVGGTVRRGSPIKLNDSAVLSNGTAPFGTITFYLFLPGVTPNDPTNPTNFAYTNVVAVSGNGTYSTATQGDNPGGFTPTLAGIYQWVAHYTGDGTIPPTTTNFGDEPHVVDPAEPSINTNAGPTVVLGSGVPLTDSATLTGGFNPTGTITFTLALNGAIVYTDVVTISGNGTYDTSMGTNPGGFLPTAPGDYQWVASYSGDANDDPVASDSDDEPQTVTLAEPTIPTTPGPTVVLGSGVPLTDSATLTGGFNPTGTITFVLMFPDGGPVYTDVVTVSGNGTYSTSQGSNPGGFLPTAVGTYHWVVSYNGDPNNDPVASELGDEPETGNPAQADLAVTKVADQTQVMVGQNVTFTVTVANKGPSTATDVVVVDPLPPGLIFVSATPSQGTYDPASGLWMVGTLAPGASATLQVTAMVATVGPIGNTAEASALQFDPDLSNNVATAPVAGSNPGSSISKRSFLADPPPAPPSVSTLRADIVFINGLYRDLLGRDAEPGGLAGWMDQLLLGRSRSAVAQGVWDSAEHRGLEVDEFYRTLLHRVADPGGRAFWVADLLAGASESDVEAGFLSSAEYRVAHPTDAAFVAGLYQDVLGRAGEPGGLAGWLAQLQGGVSRDQVIAGFVGSQEALGRAIDRDYASYLNRAAEAGGRQYFLNQLLAGGPRQQEAVGLAILASDEFFIDAAGA